VRAAFVDDQPAGKPTIKEHTNRLIANQAKHQT
jgi:hypothetical protein